MAKSRKKTTTSKNTKPKLTPLHQSINRSMKLLEGVRKYGCLLTLRHPYFSTSISCPAITDYDAVLSGVDFNLIKEIGYDTILRDFGSYYFNAINDSPNDMNLTDFWEKHSKQIVHFTFALMLLNPRMIEHELDNDNDRYFSYEITYSNILDDDYDCSFNADLHGNFNSFLRSIEDKWGKDAMVKYFDHKTI